MQLIEALRCSDQTHLAFVGAGGKTTALFRAARELIIAGAADKIHQTVLVTTTTHLGSWQASMADHTVIVKSKSNLSFLESDLAKGVLLLVGAEGNDRLSGLSSEMLEDVRVFAEDHQLPVLIEADGAQNRPLKAPDSHEPVIPGFTNTVVVVAGLTGLGKPLTDKWVYRPEIFARLSGLHLGERITSPKLVDVLLDESGGLKNIPPDANKVVLLNQADSSKLQILGYEIAQRLVLTYNAAIVASLYNKKNGFKATKEIPGDFKDRIYSVVEQVAGIVLAAGGSTRLGEPKQLLLWQGKPLIWHVVMAALSAGLAPVQVIVGASAAEVTAVLTNLPVRIVNNPAWTEGLSTSIRAGINTLPDHLGGAIFLHADQPQVSLELIKRLVETHQHSLSSIVAPRIDGQRGNPVLFDCRLFPDLLFLEGDSGGRALFTNHPVQWVDWDDADILMDIDTPEDYHKFLELHPDQDGNL